MQGPMLLQCVNSIGSAHEIAQCCEMMRLSCDNTYPIGVLVRGQGATSCRQQQINVCITLSGVRAYEWAKV